VSTRPALRYRWLRWPPETTGLKAPYLEALLSRRPIPPFAGTALGSFAVGIGTACLVLAMDRLLFAGASLPRIRSIGALPLWMRSIVPLYAAVTEEVVYRLGLMTMVVWLATVVAGRRAERPIVAAAWLGILVSAGLFALAHVANAPNATHPVLRAMALNGLSGIVLGWLYWKRGFEAAILAHFGADVFIYVVMAGVL
jgi:hypothetical protein